MVGSSVLPDSLPRASSSWTIPKQPSRSSGSPGAGSTSSRSCRRCRILPRNTTMQWNWTTWPACPCRHSNTGGSIRSTERPGNTVRRAEKKGVVVREVSLDDALARGIWIYNECRVRQGRQFPHYGKDLETVRRMSATFPGSSFFIGAFVGETLIGFMKLTTDDARSQAAVMHIIGMVQHRDKAPTTPDCPGARPAASAGSPTSCTRGLRTGRGAGQSQRLQGEQRIQADRSTSVLCRIDSEGRLVRWGLHHRLVVPVPGIRDCDRASSAVAGDVDAGRFRASPAASWTTGTASHPRRRRISCGNLSARRAWGCTRGEGGER